MLRRYSGLPAYLRVSAPADPVTALLAIINPAGGRSAFHRYTSATNTGTWRSTDLSSNAQHHEQPTSFRQPGLSGTLGAVLDGNDRIEQTINGGTFTVVIRFTKQAGHTTGVLFSDDANGSYSTYSQGVSTPIIDTYVDGNPVATQAALYTILNDGLPHTVVRRNLAMAGRTQIIIGRGSAGPVGSIRRAAVLDQGALGANLANAEAAAIQAVQATT